MDWQAYVRQQLREITGDPARDANIVDELAQHLAARFDELCASGATEREARDRVAHELRHAAEFKKAVRRADRLRPVAPVPPPVGRTRLASDLARDASYAIRLLRRTQASQSPRCSRSRSASA